MTRGSEEKGRQSIEKEREVIGQSPEKDSRPPYPSGVPEKFSVDGKVQHFPGNTIISHLSTSSPLYLPLLDLYEKLRHFHLSHLYTLLPPSSWHMTIFEGVCDQKRSPELWPGDLSKDASLEECHRHMAQKLLSSDIKCEPPYQLSIKGFEPMSTGIALRLEGRTSTEKERLRSLRDRLLETLRIRHNEHDKYVFHLSIAYLLQHLTKEQDAELAILLENALQGMPGVFELGTPEFCHFEDMFAFKRQFYLTSRERKSPAA